jgi:hypothetical protein
VTKRNAKKGDGPSQTGTYQPMKDHAVCRNHPRRMFLEAMRRIDPNVVRSLQDRLSGPFLRLLSHYRLTVAKFNRLAGTEGMPTPLPDIWGTLYPEVVRWGIEKHICREDDLHRMPNWSLDAGEFPFADWLVQVVADTLGAGAAHEIASDSWNLDHVKAACRVRPPAPEPFEFTFNPWEMFTEAWSEYVERLRKAFAESLEEYKTEAGQQPEVRSTTWGKERSFDWLVQYQVHEQTWAAIARGASPPGVRSGPSQREEKVDNFRTVPHAVKAVADWMIGRGWKAWLRESRPGRPRQRSGNGLDRDQI